VSYGEAAYTPDTPSETAKPVRLDTPPSMDVPPRRWFHTAAREWIDLSKLDPVDWGAVSTNFSNSVAHLQPPFREGHTAREDMLTARPQCEPPADISLADDHTRSGEDTSWYPRGDESVMTSGERSQFVKNCAPELVDHADDKHHTEYELSRAQLNTPPAYDWRTDAGRATVPYGRPRNGDTYT